MFVKKTNYDDIVKITYKLLMCNHRFPEREIGCNIL